MSTSIFHDAATWENDVYGGLRRSRNVAWIVAGVSAGLSATLALALVLLVPLKEPVPYVIQQDPDTGAMRALRSVQPGPLTQNEALIEYHLVQYITMREGYDRASIQEMVNRTELMTSGEALDQLRATYDAKHPDNPVGLYGTRTVSPTVKSVSLLNDQTASVRFSTDVRGRGGEQIHHYIAVIAFRFVQSPADQATRFENPLGFQVTSYRRSSEVIP